MAQYAQRPFLALDRCRRNSTRRLIAEVCSLWIPLDPVAREAVWKHIAQLRADYDTTIFLTTHYMEEAAHLCTRLAIMRQGKAMVVGTLQELEGAVGGENVTLDDVFARYTGDDIEVGGEYRATARTRRTVKRLG